MKRILLFILIGLLPLLTFAQAPQFINYQGVARDLSGQPLPNQEISLRITVFQDSISGTISYIEEHFITTSDIGLFNIQIGNGNAITGTIETIDWRSGPFLIQIELDEAGGNNFSLIGTSELVSVPYALYSNKLGPMISNGDRVVLTQEFITYPTVGNQSLLNIHVFDSTAYDPDQVLLDGIHIFKRSPTSPGDVSLTLTARSQDSFIQNGQELHAAATVVLNCISQGINQGDFTIQNEFDGPEQVRETFRIKHNGNVGIDNQDPASKLHISNGDIYIDDINSGVIMKSPNGACWRMTVNDAGQPEFNAIPCP